MLRGGRARSVLRLSRLDEGVGGLGGGKGGLKLWSRASVFCRLFSHFWIE